MLRWLFRLFFKPASLQAERRQYGVPGDTKQGERVRSKAEKYIANYFFDNNIKYVYEKELRLEPGVVLSPDFYLTDYGVYVEYWGLLDKQFYRREMAYKMKHYRRHGIRYISLYEDNMLNLNYHFRKRFKKCTGVELKTRFYKWRD